MAVFLGKDIICSSLGGILMFYFQILICDTLLFERFNRTESTRVHKTLCFITETFTRSPSFITSGKIDSKSSSAGLYVQPQRNILWPLVICLVYDKRLNSLVLLGIHYGEN